MGDEELTPESIEQKKAEVLVKMKRIKTLNTRLSKVRPKAANRFARGRLLVRMIKLAQGMDIRPDYREKVIEKLRERLEAIVDKGSARLRTESGNILEAVNRGFETRDKAKKRTRSPPT